MIVIIAQSVHNAKGAAMILNLTGLRQYARRGAEIALRHELPCQNTYSLGTALLVLTVAVMKGMITVRRV
jgi:hypothetical protein